jgi:hypothetical protein
MKANFLSHKMEMKHMEFEEACHNGDERAAEELRNQLRECQLAVEKLYELAIKADPHCKCYFFVIILNNRLIFGRCRIAIEGYSQAAQYMNSIGSFADGLAYIEKAVPLCRFREEVSCSLFEIEILRNCSKIGMYTS